MSSRVYGTLTTIVLLALVIYFPIFLHLDSLPFRLWDESYLGIHTYEMLKNGNYIVTHSFGQPEMSNCKPPFVIWCMVLSSKLLGFSIFSVRLPNAIAAVILCFTFFFFLYKYTGQWWIAFLSIVILVSNQGYVRTHVIRSGEYDSFLVLFTVCYSLLFFLIVMQEDPQKRKKLLVLFSVCVIGALLTKGIAALIPAPGLLLFLLMQKKFKEVVFSYSFLVSIIVISFVTLGYYLLREQMNPGYIKAVYDNELGGRFLVPIEGNNGPIWLYVKDFFFNRFLYWTPFFVIGILSIWYNSISTTIKTRQFILFALLVSFSHLFFISISATKLNFYAAPEYPFYSFIAAIGVFFVASKIADGIRGFTKIALPIVVTLLCVFPYYKTVDYVMSDSEDPWYNKFYQMGYFFKYAEKQHLNLNHYKLIYSGATIRPLICHVNHLRELGQEVKISNAKGVKEGDTVIIHTNEDRAFIESRMLFSEMIKRNEITVWKIGKAKSSNDLKN